MRRAGEIEYALERLRLDGLSLSAVQISRVQLILCLVGDDPSAAVRVSVESSIWVQDPRGVREHISDATQAGQRVLGMLDSSIVGMHLEGHDLIIIWSGGERTGLIADGEPYESYQIHGPGEAIVVV